MGICFAFSEDLKHVLLVNKTKGPDAARGWNGVGGKFNRYEDSYSGIVREFCEETGYQFPSTFQPLFLCSTVYEDGAVLDVYFCSITPKSLSRMEGEVGTNDVGEKLMWHDTNDVTYVTAANSCYAGYGNVPHFVRWCHKHLTDIKSGMGAV
jgi:8-oxo-dGTP pyrophosphatase MutT (NUDIX family)